MISFFFQVEDLRLKLTRGTVSKQEDNEILVKIPLMTQIFKLTIRKPKDFPNDTPSLDGDFIAGFDDFEWSSERTLFELADHYADFCSALDVAILEIKDADTDGFPVEKLEIDEDESGHLFVRLNAIKYRETVTMSVNVDDVHGFPRILRCSNPTRMSDFDCEKWVSDEKIGRNLRRFYGELKERPQEIVERVEAESQGKDSFDDEIMDFI